MARLSHQLIAISIALSVLMAALVACTHSHFADPAKSDVIAISAVCDCTSHQQQNSGDPVGDSDESGSCLVCRLLAEMQTDLVLPTVPPLDTAVSLSYLSIVDSDTRDVIRRYQGRAPPIA